MHDDAGRTALTRSRFLLSAALTGCSALVWAACSDAPTNNKPGAPTRAVGPAGAGGSKAALARTRGEEEVKAAVQGRQLRGAEDEILRLEAEAPGVGGAFVDGASGRFVVLLKAPADGPQRESQREGQRARASAAIGRFRARVGAGSPAFTEIEKAGVEYREAAFTFSELLGWKEALTSDLLALPGVASVDADERENKVHVGITDESARTAVMNAAAQAGAPAGLLTLERIPQPVMLQASLVNQVRPVGNGMEIENEGRGWCTAGWMVRASDGNLGILTASHCSNSTVGSGRVGEPMWQGDAGVSRDRINTVFINPAWPQGCYASVGDPDPFFPGPCTQADAMFIGFSEIHGKTPRIAPTGASQVGSRDFPPEPKWYFDTRLPFRYPWAGQDAQKAGRTTGVTGGVIASTCVDVKLFFRGSNTFAVETCQGQVNNAAVGEGDSGGPVYILAGGQTVYPLGVLTGGGPLTSYRTEYQGGVGTTIHFCSSNCSFYYSQWSNIEQRLVRYFTPLAGSQDAGT